jgi:RNA polymerase sigma-70 factor
VAPALRSGRAAWPKILVSEAAFAAYLEDIKVDDEDLTRFAADLYLACGCLARDPAALQAFDRQVLPVIERHVTKAGLLKQTPREDVSQILSIWLLAGPRPRLARYSGRGSLVGWLKVVASRRALRLTLRQRPGPGPLDERTAARLAADCTSPEVGATRNLFRTDFQRALDASVAALSPHARAILHMHYVKGLTLDEIGEHHRVHRATVARWLAGIRTTVMAQLRERLTTARPTSSDFRSLALAMREELHLSLDRLLTSAA